MLSYSRVIVPIDFSPGSEAAARFAQAMGERFHSKVLLVHVEGEPPLLGGDGGGAPPFGTIDHTMWLKSRLQTFLASEMAPDSISRLLLRGDPAVRIAELARESRDCFIVMAAHGHGPVREFVLQSVVARVLRDADCPVCTTVNFTGTGIFTTSGRTVACAIDMGPHTTSTIKWAWEYARICHAQLRVIHMLRDRSVSLVEAEIRDMLELLGIEAKIAAVAGSVASDTVCGVTADLAADILVIGRCRTARRLHSDTYGIIRQSHCPVVSV